MKFDKVARRGDDAEGVHQLRVGSRRLGAELKIFTPVLKPKSRLKLKKELRWIGKILGRQRDLDVLHTLFVDLLGNEPISTKVPVLSQLTKRRNAEQRSVAQALKSRRYRKFVHSLSGSLRQARMHSVAAQPAHDVFTPGLRRTLTSLFSTVDSVGPSPSDEQLHRIRKIVKRSRYGADVAARFLGTEAEAIVERLAQAQEVLGDFHDRVVATTYLKQQSSNDTADDESFENANAIAFLDRKLKESMDELRTKWREPIEQVRTLSTQLWNDVTSHQKKS